MNKHLYYDETSKGYDVLHGEEQNNKLSLIKKELGINFNKVLDVGAGTGLSSDFFKNVVCLEPSKKMLEQGLKKRNFLAVNDCAENVSFLFQEDEFDLLICVSAIHHFEKLKETLTGFRQVCKKNADIVITFLKRANTTPDLISFCKDFFEFKKELVEEKDIILFFKNNK